MQFEVYDASNYCKGIFFFLIMGVVDAMLLYFLINSHCCCWMYFVLWEPGKPGAIFFFSSLFIWVEKLCKGFLVNKMDLLSSNSSSWEENK